MNWRHAAQTVLGLLVLALAALSTIASVTSMPEAGVETDGPGGIVQHVDPGGLAWRDDIRPGQTVVTLHESDAETGWELWTTDGQVFNSTQAVHQLELVRSYIAWSVVALAIAGVSALLAYRHHPAAAALLPLALFLAAQPMLLSGSLVAELGAGAAFFIAAPIAAVAFTRWRPILVVPVAAGAGLAALWIVSILAIPDLFDSVDATRVPAAAGFSLLGFTSVSERRRITEFLTGRSGPAFVDLLYLGLAVALLVAGVLSIIPLLPAFVVTALAVAAYPVWRRATVVAFERLVTSRARRDAAIRAVEDERGRVARDIHDAPLQELSGVIRRLEGVPGVEREADTLRNVASHLRDVATSLHPPVLQDLGLAAAIADLGDQLAGTALAWQIGVEVDDLTNGRRPPADVELAGFRVTQEAIANALAHSGGSSVLVRGSVSADVIELAVCDDGRGLHDEDARAAKRRGHFGLDSMRERAEAVGGSTSLTSGSTGMCVQFHWEGQAS